MDALRVKCPRCGVPGGIPCYTEAPGLIAHRRSIPHKVRRDAARVREAERGEKEGRNA